VSVTGEVRGDPDHPANFGRLCSKGAALAATLNDSRRLRRPTLSPAIRGSRSGTLFPIRKDAFTSDFKSTYRAQIPNGIPMKQQINNAEHVVMDVEHAHLLMQVARKYATTASARRKILSGARESLMIDRVYRGHLADMLEALS